ncbi:two-component system histidine kinase PnpS [Clostridium cylindrosporum]|uniref:histidine kinase n=1 Tax=Clostridium cylindrosporum DSM 605 TaxID=1121307 RepID=A0A0J8DAU7_CLOCY|nr:ATP-binding protein [Clostridium cylindrosporum]KMT21423.1 alkaline phosphatase synthesis sensor protein PhoR [Clostridium cylindrosporum DSM 605]
MRKKLFGFFMIIIILTVGVTGIVSYRFTKNLILQTNKESLQAEALITQEYIKEHERSSFNDITKIIKEKIKRRVTIVDSNGVVVGDSDADAKRLDNHKNRKEVVEALKSGEGDSIRFSDTEKIPMYYYARKMSIDGKDYVVRLAIKFDSIREIQYNYFKIILFTIIGGIMISSIFMYKYISMITKPIIKLTKLATTISLGNYDKRIKVSSKDEIGQLSTAFNLMAQRLQDTIANLGDKQNKLMSILSNSEDGVIVLDNNKRILLLNPAAQMMFNLDENIIGKYFIEVIRNYDLENIIKDVPEEEVEITISYPSVKHLKIRATSAINYENGEEVLGVLIIVQDITKVKLLEQMRSDFVANVSHELKTPLTSIKGFAETLKYVEDKETRDKFLDIINIEAERLSRLISDILTLSELENRDMLEGFEKIKVNDSINEVYHITKPIADSKDINIVYKENLEEYIVVGDRDKFKQMLINVVDNAIKYTNEGGYIYISLSREGNNLIIKVKDTGIGIPSEHIPRLFERFYRVDKGRSRDSGGTGLGLAIVKHIVILLKGEVKVESEINSGTTFTITLPLFNQKLT